MPQNQIYQQFSLEIKEEILMHLPIKNVVRTSILLFQWRCIWASLPNLVFDECYFQFDIKFSGVVDYVLALHNGWIHKFHLRKVSQKNKKKMNAFISGSLWYQGRKCKNLNLNYFNNHATLSILVSSVVMNSGIFIFLTAPLFYQ